MYQRGMINQKHTLLAFLLCLIELTSQASPDSLKQLFHNSANASHRTRLAYEISKQSLFSDPDTALVYLFSAIKDSVSISDEPDFGNCLNLLGIYHFYRSNWDSTVHYCTRSLRVFENIGDTPGALKSRKNIALARRSQGNYELALSEFFVVLEQLKKQDDTRSIIAALNDIGNTYAYLKEFGNSVNYQHEALRYLQTTEDPRLEANVYNSLGVAFNNTGQLDSARYYYRESLKLKEKYGNIYSIINTRNNLCIIIDYKSEPEECEECFRQLIKDQRQVDNIDGIARSYINLSIRFSHFNECTEALRMLDSANLYLQKSNDIFLRQDLYRTYASTLSQCGNYRFAYRYQDSLRRINDSIFNIQKHRELIALDTEFRTQQKNDSIELLNTRNANTQLKVKNQQWQIIFLFMIIFGILVGGFLLFFFYKQRQRREREIAIVKMREAERIRIARDMHDEIGSGLTRISLMSEQERMYNGKEVAVRPNNIHKIIDQSRLLSKNLREIIWAIDPSNDTLAELIFYLRDYINDFALHSVIDADIDFPEDFTDMVIGSEIRRNLFLAVKESLNNIAKYARATEISVRLEIRENCATVLIKDNGIGFDPEQAKKGLGLDSIKARAVKLSGSFELDSNPGAGTSIALKDLLLSTTNM